MFIIAVEGKEKEGAYSVIDEDGEQVLYIFADGDDATRYCMQLEELDYPKMKVLEIDDKLMVKTCELHEHRYTIITPNDIVIPPDNADDYLWEGSLEKLFKYRESIYWNTIEWVSIHNDCGH